MSLEKILIANGFVNATEFYYFEFEEDGWVEIDKEGIATIYQTHDSIGYWDKVILPVSISNLAALYSLFFLIGLIDDSGEIDNLIV